MEEEKYLIKNLKRIKKVNKILTTIQIMIVGIIVYLFVVVGISKNNNSCNEQSRYDINTVNIMREKADSKTNLLLSNLTFLD